MQKIVISSHCSRMPCFFCSSNEHLTENCNIYPTLESRYEKLNYSFLPCLCEVNPVDPKEPLSIGYSCLCNKPCDVCLQEHHVALCPKRDPNHPFFADDHNLSLNFLGLPSLIHGRLFELCNPINTLKLQMTCKYLNQFHPLQYKLYSLAFDDVTNLKVIFIGAASIEGYTAFSSFTQKPCFNLEMFEMKSRRIRKADLQVLCKSDPIAVYFTHCSFEYGLSFRACLDLFPYTLVFALSYIMLPTTWIRDLRETKRNVSLRKLDISTYGTFPEINMKKLGKLLQTHRNLVITFILGIGFDYATASKKINNVMCKGKFFISCIFSPCRIKFIFEGNRNTTVMFGYKKEL